MKILVVDDDSGTRNALSACLTSSGHETVVAEDAHQAMVEINNSAIGHEPVQLLVTDLKMPGMNGLDLIREVKKKRPGFPAILITAHGNDSVRWQVLGLRSCGYLEKPFSPESLLEKTEDEMLWEVVWEEKKKNGFRKN